MDEGSEFQKGLEQLVEALEALIDKLPVPPALKNRLRNDIKTLREMLLSQRPPRFAMIGRRGAGKSSLINALLGEKVAEVSGVVEGTIQARWYDCHSSKGVLCLLDTRGAQGAADQDGSGAALASFRDAVRSGVPDAILFLCKAKEVDAAIQPDIRFLEAVCTDCRQIAQYRPPVLGLVTQVDELDPPDLRAPQEFGDEEKSANIARAVEVLQTHLMASQMPQDAIVKVMPISAYMRFGKDGAVVVDNRWNIDTLADLLSAHMHHSAQLQFARLSSVKSIQRRTAKYLMNAFAGLAAAVAAIPIPVADLVPITSLQVTMLTAIGYISGRKLSLQAVGEFTASMGVTVGAGFLFREAARQLLKLVPVAGEAGSAAIAYAGTMALGRAAVAYYVDGTSIEDARRLYRESKDGQTGSTADDE